MSDNRPFAMAFAAFAVAAITVLSASQASAEKITLTGPSELTDPTVPGQQTDPSSVVYGGLLYAFWSSNSAETPLGGDFDITYSTYDGHEWSQNAVLTSNDTGNDHTPRPVLFGGRLYLFWSSNNAAITGGTHADIVLSTFDGSSWSSPESLTSGFGSSGDYLPCPVVCNQRLYVFFEWFSAQSNAYEIGYTRYDGTWEQPTAITDSSTGHNLNPTAAVAGEDLVLAWESTSSAFTGTAERCIVSRVLTGASWSGFVSLSGGAGPVNSDPCAVAYSGDVWVFWSADSENLTLGSDLDIVCRRYGAGGWEDTVYEIAAVQDSGDDTGVAASVHGDRLAVVWISGSPEYSDGTDTDIVMACFDGAEWSSPLGVSSGDGGRDDGGGFTYRAPSMSSYGGTLVILWETNASPFLTVTANTWLAVSECEFSDGGNDYRWLAVPLIAAVIAAFFLFRKKR